MARACREGRADLGRLRREQRVQPSRRMSTACLRLSAACVRHGVSVRGMCGKRKEESVRASVMRESRERVERVERMGRVEPSHHTPLLFCSPHATPPHCLLSHRSNLPLRSSSSSRCRRDPTVHSFASHHTATLRAHEGSHGTHASSAEPHSLRCTSCVARTRTLRRCCCCIHSATRIHTLRTLRHRATLPAAVARNHTQIFPWRRLRSTLVRNFSSRLLAALQPERSHPPSARCAFSAESKTPCPTLPPTLGFPQTLSCSPSLLLVCRRSMHTVRFGVTHLTLLAPVYAASKFFLL